MQLRTAAVAMLLAVLCADASAQLSRLLPERYQFESTGRYAELAAQQEREVAKKASAENLYNLCYAYSKLKDYRKLFGCVDRLEGAIRAGDDKVAFFFSPGMSDGTMTPHLFRAEAYVELSEYRKAIPEAEKARAIVDKMSSMSGVNETMLKIQALGLLGLSQMLAGERAKAQETLAALDGLQLGFLAIAAKAPLKNRGLARMHMALGDCAKVLEVLGRSDFGWVRAFGSALVGGGENLFANIELPNAYIRHRCQLETGKAAEAREGFDKLLSTPQVAQFGEIYWLVLFDRGRIAEADGSPKAALEHYRKAIDTIERQRASINTEASKIGFVGDKQAVYERVIALLVQEGDAAAALEYVERSKARALVDMLASRQEFAAPGLSPEEGRMILARLDEADRLSRAPQLAEAGASTGMRSLQVAQREVQAAAPELSSLVTVTSAPAQELQRLLGEGEVLVEYYYAGKELYAFVATRERVQATRLELGGLVADIERLRREIEGLNADWERTSRDLYARLWAPIEASARGRSVTVVPHGALHYLPFSALVAADGSLLVERQGLRLLPSASVMKYLKPAVAGAKGGLMLALGNPDLGDPKMDLKFAEAEAVAVSQMFPESRLLLRREASKTNFMQASRLFSRLHFATHGKFVAGEPLSSGLLLAKGEEAEGTLTVGELYSMSLPADLVTLSACETGLGAIGNGDDVVGLTRGFLYAGARSIVASLWSVDDRATGQLMRSFYGNLEKMPKDQALIQAQLDMRREFPHPFFWAAFHLTGRAD